MQSARIGRSIAALLLFALLLRAAVLGFTPDALKVDPDGYRAVAENLARYGTFGSRQSPTAYRPPLYPCLLAACVALGPASRQAIGVVHLALGLGTVWLTYRLGQSCGLGRWAWLAAALVACDPILLAQSTLVMTETLATLLAAAALTCLAIAAQRRSVRWATASGVAVGLCVLCRPTFLPWAILVAFVLLGTGRKARPFVLALAFSAATAAVVAPWAIRNQVQFGRPIVTTTHGGYTLLLANNPDFYQHLRSAGWGAVWENKALDRAWAAKVAQGAPGDEVRADRLAYAEAVANIRNEPATFCYACLVRVGRLFGVLPHPLAADEGAGRRLLRYGIGLWYVVELGLAALGAAIFFARVGQSPGRGSGSRGRVSARRAAESPAPAIFETSDALETASDHFGWIFGALLVVSFAAVHALFWTDMRMRAPLMPTLAIAAAFGLASLAGRMTRRNPFLS